MPAAPIIGAVAAVAGAGVAVVGTVSSIKAQKKAANAQQDQFKYQRAMDNNRAARERVQAIRAARLSYGGAQQAAVNQGAQNSSASLGGLGSIASQLNSNLSFLQTTEFLTKPRRQELEQLNMELRQKFGAVSLILVCKYLMQQVALMPSKKDFKFWKKTSSTVLIQALYRQTLTLNLSVTLT
jgi:hypothetical protein